MELLSFQVGAEKEEIWPRTYAWKCL